MSLQKLPVQTLLTLEDALALPDRDDCRYELDEGELIESPLPRPRHQIIVAKMPESRAVQIYTQTDVRGTDELTSTMLSGFTLPVASLFA